LGVPLRVGLSAASPRSCLAVGFPLQSLTRQSAYLQSSNLCAAQKNKKLPIKKASDNQNFSPRFRKTISYFRARFKQQILQFNEITELPFTL